MNSESEISTASDPPSFSASVLHTLKMPPPAPIALSLSQLEPMKAKKLTGTEPWKNGRKTIEQHARQLREQGRLSFPEDQPCLVLSVRNVLANLRCVGWIQGLTPYPVGVSEEPQKISRPWFAIGQTAEAGKLVAERVQPDAAACERFRWFVSGVPVLWEGETESSLFRLLVAECADFSHIWRIPRAHHPETRPETEARWNEFRETFLECLEQDLGVDAAFERLNNLARAAKLQREDEGLHHLLGVDEEGGLYEVIGTGQLENLGRRLRALGATRGIVVDNSGSTSVRFYPNGLGAEDDFKQLLSGPNHRPAGSAYLFVPLSSSKYSLRPANLDASQSPPPPLPANLEGGENLRDFREQYLSLFVNGTDGRAYRNADALVGGRSISLVEKIDLEIEQRVQELRDRRAIAAPLPAAGAPEITWIPLSETARARTAGMLLALRALFRSEHRRETKLDLETAAVGGWGLAPEFLLIKAVLWSQLRWGAEHAFEFGSANQARLVLGDLLNCCFGEDFAPPPAWADVITSSIRWHTLPSQFSNGSASFGPDHPLLDFNEAERAATAVLAACYEQLRKNDYRLEKAARDFLTGKTASIPVSTPPDLAKRPPEIDESRPLLINTHIREAVGANEGIDVRESALVAALEESSNQISGIAHFVFDRIQLDLGVKWVEADDFQKHDLIIRTQEARERVDPRGRGVGETLIDVAVHPIPAARFLYGLELEKGGNDSAARFLADSFGRIRKDPRFDGVLPLPLVGRLLDLAAAYRLLDPDGGFRAPGEPAQIFRAILSFEIGDRLATREIWLPDVENEAEFAELAGSSEVARETLDVIGRYLVFTITNQGISRGYRSVDIDFSDSRSYEPGASHFYRQLLIEKRNLTGAAVFHEYLNRMRTGQLEEAFARRRFEPALSTQNLLEPHRLNTLENLEPWQNIVGQLVVGIDVGGTTVKIQVYRIERSKNRPERAWRFAGVDDTSEKIWLAEIAQRAAPTKRPIGIFRDGADFAGYLHDTFSQAVGTEISEALVACVGVCWPGPVGGNRVVMTSGILKQFVEPGRENPFAGRIFKDAPESILKLKIAESIQEKFGAPAFISNDGDSETIGLLYHRNDHSKSEQSAVWSQLFRRSVVVVKAGTGAAGSALENGVVTGLMELGKIVIDLAASNEGNEEKELENRWPAGELNSFFSVNFLRPEARKLGIGGWKEVSGRDLDLLHGLLSNPQLESDFVRLFGAAELDGQAAPWVNWGDLVTASEGRQLPVRGKSLDFENGQFRLEDDPDETIKPAAKSKLEATSDSFENLLSELGQRRLHALKIRPEDGSIASPGAIEQIGERMGRRLADLVACLQDSAAIDAVFIAGGPLRGVIGEKCAESFDRAVRPYLRDRYHRPENALLRCAEATEWILTQPPERRPDLFFEHVSESSNAMLGAALLALDQHLRELKIRELQLLKKHGPRESAAPRVFHSKEERERFLALHPDVAT